MSKGLIIGKFMPPHLGHLALIDFGLKKCDKLVVAVCSRPNEPIPGKLRFCWMRQIFQDNPRITIEQIKANLPQEKKSSRKASIVWARYIKKRFPDIDTIFSSEKYGDYLAEYMGVKNILFDKKRAKYNISGTKIRNSPYKYWKFIPKVVRPYFVKRICVYGPESTGKSTLAKKLAEHYKTEYVPEYARDYIGRNGNKFTYKDMENVAIGHLKSEKRALASANKLLFTDTDFITTQIYSQHYFGKCPRIVDELARKESYDLYLFCDIDLPWKADPQRDLGHRREEFREIFLNKLIERHVKYSTVNGSGNVRLANAIKSVDSYFRL
jgi:HTH-type transcriptional repressor of NAD biosynthesis genes